VAIVDGPRRITYADLLERSLGLAALLRHAGLARGGRVGIFLRRSVEAVVAFFATHFAGGVAVVINEQLRGRQVRHILEHSEAGLLVTDSRQLLYAAEPLADETRIVNLDRVTPAVPLASPERTIGADLALIIYTSGSTGLPKGVMLSHTNLLSGAQIVSDYLNLTERDIIISLLPFSFDCGLNQLLTALLVGGTLVIQRSAPCSPRISAGRFDARTSRGWPGFRPCGFS
jgi:long-subunit acyl-CoA synthetase (AMP-forming)